MYPQANIGHSDSRLFYATRISFVLLDLLRVGFAQRGPAVQTGSGTEPGAVATGLLRSLSRPHPVATAPGSVTARFQQIRSFDERGTTFL